VATRTDVLAVSVPGLRAVRWWTDELYARMKETYTITRVESGHSEWWRDGVLRRSAPGSFQITQPGDVHREISRDGPITLQIVSLPAPIVESVIGNVRLHNQFAANDERASAFRRLHDAVQAGVDRLALEVSVAEAITALAAIGDTRCVHTRPVRRAIELLRAQLAQTVTLDDLAAHAGLDKFHLCRAFRAQVGMPPYAYLTHLRIARAKELLAAGMKPSEIAPQIGLYDQSQLNRHFRRIVGTTPARYARSV
jgi:AraC-like DNA-binding protein